MGGVFFSRNTLEGCTETHKSSFFSYKQVSGRNGDHEWLRMTNAFILCDLVWNVQKSHAANREGSFKNTHIIYLSRISLIHQISSNHLKKDQIKALWTSSYQDSNFNKEDIIYTNNTEPCIEPLSHFTINITCHTTISEFTITMLMSRDRSICRVTDLGAKLVHRTYWRVGLNHVDPRGSQCITDRDRSLRECTNRVLSYAYSWMNEWFILHNNIQYTYFYVYLNN